MLRRAELLAVIAVALLLITCGLVWLFGPFALIGVGVFLLVVTFFVPVEEVTG